MRAEEFEFLYQLEERFWWFVGMRQITDAVVGKLNGGPRAILDAGCGTGFNLGHYAPNGQVFGLDLSADAIDGVRKRGFRRVAQASIAEIPYASNSFDLVFSFDVVCQVPLSLVESSMREMSRVLRPGGVFFIRVPALPWMRSSHDEAVQTVQRFSLPQLNAEVTRAGLNVEWSSYANCFLLPVVILRRMMKSIGIATGSDVRPLPAGLGWIDPILKRVLLAEAGFMRKRYTLPVGLSAICLARKPT